MTDAERNSVVPKNSRIKSKLLEVIEACNLDISAEKKQALAEQMNVMIWTWLRKPDEERDTYLRKESQRILYRLGLQRNQFSVMVFGHTRQSASDEEITQTATTYLKRVRREILRAARRSQSSFPEFEPAPIPKFEISTVKRDGKTFRIISHLDAGALSEQYVRRGLSRARRNKGRVEIKISRASYAKLTSLGVQEQLFREIAASP